MPSPSERMCPRCGKRNDNNQPAPGSPNAIVDGSYLICAHCGELLIATETGARIPSTDERAAGLALEHVRSAYRWVNERLAPARAQNGR